MDKTPQLLTYERGYNKGFEDGYDNGFEDALFAMIDDIKTEYFNYFDKAMHGGDQNETSE